MEATTSTQKLIDLTKPLCAELVRDPKIPSNVCNSELICFVEESAPLLLIVFGSPVLASEGIVQLFDKVFARLDGIQDSLGRIEQCVERIELKYDTAVLARFMAGFREMQGGIKASRPQLREQLVLSARSKLTEIAELPTNLQYSGVSSSKVAASACLLLVMIDAWLGELRSALRYALMALSSDPEWAEEFLPSALIQSIAGQRIKIIEDELSGKIAKELQKHHDFLLEKLACGAGGAGAIALGLTGVGFPAALAGAGLLSQIGDFDKPEAQQAAHEKAISELKKESLELKFMAIREEADNRLKRFDAYQESSNN